MKSKKNLGFTMIEMLATILVLLVILLVATPSIRRMLNKTNELYEEYCNEYPSKNSVSDILIGEMELDNVCVHVRIVKF